MHRSRNSERGKLGERSRCAAVLLLMGLSNVGCPLVDLPPLGVYFSYVLYYFHPDDGTKVPLSLYRREIVIEFEEGLSESDRAAIVAGEGILTGELHSGAGRQFAQIAEGATAKEILDAVHALRLTEGVRGAEIIVMRHLVAAGLCTQYPRGREISTPVFSAEFCTDTPRAEIDALNASYGLRVNGTDHEHEFDAEPRLRYELTPIDRTELTTIELANLYHENTAAFRAWPHLYPLDIVDGPVRCPGLNWGKWRENRDSGAIEKGGSRAVAVKLAS